MRGLAADEFQQSGSREAAACVVHLLGVVAHEDAMTGAMSTNQAYYVQGWTLGGVASTPMSIAVPSELEATPTGH